MKYLILYKSFLFCWIKGKLRQNLFILFIIIVSFFSFLSAYSCFCNSDFEVNVIPDSNAYIIDISNGYNNETINYISQRLPSVIYNREPNGYFYYQYKNTDYCEFIGVMAVLNDGFKEHFRYNNNYSVHSGRDFTESELNECSNVIIVNKKPLIQSCYCISGKFIREYQYQNTKQNPFSRNKKPKLNIENSAMYFFVFPGQTELYCLNVIRLAREAISVPTPPILTPSRRFL